MDFQLTEEQKLIKESVRDWFERNLPLDRVRELDTTGHPYRQDIPTGLGEL